MFLIIALIWYYKEKQTVTSKDKMTTEKVFIEVGSQVFQVATQILHNQEIYTLIGNLNTEYSCKIKNLMKLPGLYKTRGDYIQCPMTTK